MVYIRLIFSVGVLAPLAVLIGSVILLRKQGGVPAILQIVGCAAYLIYFWFEIFVAETSAPYTFGPGNYPSWTWLDVARYSLGILILCYPVGFIWFVLRVTRRT